MRTRQLPSQGPLDRDPGRARASGQPNTRAGSTVPTPRTRTARTRAGGSAPPFAPAPGPLVLDRYRLHRRLGAGAFGSVWQAHDERLHRDVAVKLLPRGRIAGGRFEREATAAARLAHPGIVTLYEAAVDDEGAYLVSELVIGPTLDRLLGDGRLSDRRIALIGLALCDALGHAHGLGVVHRDVKPSNVLVPRRPATPAEVAKLTDFGVARLIGGNPLTRTGDVIGTMAYMAPEQAAGRPADAASDLYSLALVLYEALTGINPLVGASSSRRLGIHLPPLRRQRRELPRALGQGIDLALRPRPRERGTLEELRAVLEEAVEHLEDRPGLVAGPAPLWRRSEDAREESQDPLDPRSTRRQIRESGQPAGESAGEHEAATAHRAPWAGRALAGATAAGLIAWVVAHVLGRPPLTPTSAALLAGVLVAALPRLGWLALTSGAAATLVLQNRPGTALLIALGMLAPVVLLLRAPKTWPLAAVAPGLGIIALAGAWPALASRAGTLWRRGSLAILGWIWLWLVGALAHKSLYMNTRAAIPPPGHWLHSLSSTLSEVVSPLLSVGSLSAAAVWVLAAVVLPLARRRSPLADFAVVAAWSSMLAIASSALAPQILPGEALLGAIGAILLTLAPDVTSRWVHSLTSTTPQRDFRSMEAR